MRKGGEHHGSRWARNRHNPAYHELHQGCCGLHLFMVSRKQFWSLSSKTKERSWLWSFVLGREASLGQVWHRIFAVVFSFALLGCSWQMTPGSGYDRTFRETAMHCLLTQLLCFKRWMVFWKLLHLTPHFTLEPSETQEDWKMTFPRSGEISAVRKQKMGSCSWKDEWHLLLACGTQFAYLATHYYS